MVFVQDGARALVQLLTLGEVPLCTCRFKIWLENDDRTDDITAMVFHLQYDGEARPERSEEQKKVRAARAAGARESATHSPRTNPASFAATC